ncbi:TetR/AcrR family transcriptional regulator [Lactobacillus sp. ESL0791]|uniref:TetR/AcrR family transcriptional regulator n=1 Tax=Lactobacillus sp. ESL0791 TaxID=2983234 RepID=UPI0023F75DAA|nr:TetR/AcrR family transcriptional regulator [Lactobacillus sp. ESL0791]MDF7638226.1 TetR/AcrR family transcriptional regulator [Lactobacillus sp. ESL0791]
MVHKRNLDLDKIIQEATKLICEQGLTKTTLPNLAKALGVRSQSLYHYVSGRKQLLSLVGASRIKLLHRELVDQLIGFAGSNALLKFADVVRSFILHDPALFSILYHLNEYSGEDAITLEIINIIALAEKLNLKNTSMVSLHALLGSVLGYVFLDKATFFKDEDDEKDNRNYHEMILRLVQPAA